MSDDEPPDYSTVWDADALVAKSQRYVEKMLATPRDDWDFALWSSLALEFLLRAALADHSPALLADTKDVNNLLSAVGIQPKAKKFIPKSIGIKDVIDRFSMIVPEFTSELAGFSHRHTTQRNAELHSGQTAFDGIKHSTWLPVFYQTCKVLLVDLFRDLPDLFPKEEAETAEKLIATLADDAAKAVKATINAHEMVWSKKDGDEHDESVSDCDHLGHEARGPSRQMPCMQV